MSSTDLIGYGRMRPLKPLYHLYGGLHSFVVFIYALNFQCIIRHLHNISKCPQNQYINILLCINFLVVALHRIDLTQWDTRMFRAFLQLENNKQSIFERIFCKTCNLYDLPFKPHFWPVICQVYVCTPHYTRREAKLLKQNTAFKNRCKKFMLNSVVQKKNR